MYYYYRRQVLLRRKSIFLPVNFRAVYCNNSFPTDGNIFRTKNDAFSRTISNVSTSWKIVYYIQKMVSQCWKPIFPLVETSIFTCKAYFGKVLDTWLLLGETNIFACKKMFTRSRRIHLTSGNSIFPIGENIFSAIENSCFCL